MNIPLLNTIKSADQARDLAIEWQGWQSEQALYQSEAIDWSGFWQSVVERFPELEDEFKENAII